MALLAIYHDQNGYLIAHILVMRTYLTTSLGSMMLRFCKLLNLSMARQPSGWKANTAAYNESLTTASIHTGLPSCHQSIVKMLNQEYLQNQPSQSITS